MLGQIAQLTNLLRNAGRITQGMQEMNSRLAEARFVGEAGGGQVRATVNGRTELIALTIDPALLRTDDSELLEDLVVAAVNDAARKSREAAQKEMQSLAGGLDLGEISKMLGGMPSSDK